MTLTVEKLRQTVRGNRNSLVKFKPKKKEAQS